MTDPYTRPPVPRPPDMRPWRKRKRVWAAGILLFGLGAMGGTQSAQDEVNAAKAAAAGPRPTVTVTATATATVTVTPKPRVTVTKTVRTPGPTKTVTEAAQDAGADTSGSSDTGTCSIVSNSGNCYEAGQYCRNRDHGASTTDAGGAGITCAYRNGWRWTYS
ncbi:hypothetical protein SMIR_27920 [Streptomyces mirabilis]|uniref:hypothetical protein n=1 Tax=Streptomyces mirabilis TaxID=68239 RepID=UPI001BAFAC3C|nr:hypothetical protein [Streptomyces mirabilis]QUW82451.1 hypothetical protein SMIR_27920 [Streptomyces mirabilis]